MRKIFLKALGVIGSMGMMALPMAFAEEGAHGAHEIAGPDRALLFSVINFAILSILLFKLLNKPVREFFAARAEAIRATVDEASLAHAQAAHDHQEITRRLQKVNTEAAELIKSLREEGEMERKKIIENANEFSARLKHDSQRIADAEMKKAREELKETAVHLARDLAGKIVVQVMDDREEEKLSKRYLEQLKQA